LEVKVKDYSTDQIRNIGLVSHAAVGKTSLAEAMGFLMGVSNRLGTVEEGSTITDYNADEIARKISISAAMLHGFWKDRKINIIDMPGYSDFIGEVKGGLRVVETAVVLINAVAGVEVGTETVWKFAREYGNSSIFFVNRLDKEHANFDEILNLLQGRFGDAVVPFQFPVNAGSEAFDTIVDALRMKAFQYDKSGSGKTTPIDVPAEFQGRAEELHAKIVERAAEADDELLEKFFEDEGLSADDLRRGLRKAINNGTLFPVLCGAATTNIGVRGLLDFVSEYAPSPADRPGIKGTDPKTQQEVSREPTLESPMAALVFKTVSEPHVGELSFLRVYSGKLSAGSEAFNSKRNLTEKIGQLYMMNGKTRHEVGYLIAGDIGTVVKLRDTHTGDTLCDPRQPVVLEEIRFPDPVIRIAVEPKAKGDEDKISSGLQVLHEEDPTFVANYDSEIRQIIIAGQGELHLDIVVKRLKDKFGVDVNLVEPKIPYRETIRKNAEAQGKYKKQTGGRGQYGDVWLRLEPLPRGAGFEFVDAIVGGVVPSKYIPAVEKGVREAMAEGVVAGYPVMDVKVTLYDGSYHPVDSSDMAFKIAGSMGFKKAFKEANPVILEPIYDVEVTVPEEFMGDVMGDISSRRGKIMGMESEGPFQVIKAKVPLAELYRYSTTLRSLTQGRGIHRRKFSHYEQVPADIQQKLVEEAEAAKEK
jgi:elongation factor G